MAGFELAPGEEKYRSARAVFAADLAELFEAAGNPTLSRVARNTATLTKAGGVGRLRPVSMQRISDWRRGQTVPHQFETVLPVLLTLINLAQSASTAVRPELIDVTAWRRRWKAAKTESDNSPPQTNPISPRTTSATDRTDGPDAGPGGANESAAAPTAVDAGADNAPEPRQRRASVGSLPAGRRRTAFAVSAVVCLALVGVVVGITLRPRPSPDATVTVAVGKGPRGIAFDATENVLYVANQNSGYLSVVDPYTNSVTATIRTRVGISDVAVDPRNGTVYLDSWAAHSITVMRHRKVIADIPDVPAGYAIVVDPRTGTVYVSNYDADSLSVISGTTVVQTIALRPGSKPIGLALDPDNADIVYVACQKNNTVAVVDVAAGAIQREYQTGMEPWGIAYDHTDRTIYTSNFLDGTISAISAATGRTVVIPVDDEPNSLTFDPDTHLLYTTNWGSNTLSVIDTLTRRVVGVAKTGAMPSEVAVDPHSRVAYVSNWSKGDTGSVSAVPASAYNTSPSTGASK